MGCRSCTASPLGVGDAASQDLVFTAKGWLKWEWSKAKIRKFFGICLVTGARAEGRGHGSAASRLGMCFDFHK